MDDTVNMDVEILHIAECPNWQAVKPLIETAIGQQALSRTAIRFRLLTSEAEAKELDFAGSPTIFVNGRDLFPTTGYPGGLACRVYPTPEGLAGMPTLAQVKEALHVRSQEGAYKCDCCGRELPRKRLHAIGEPPSYICRRCGLWVAMRRRQDAF